MKRLSTLAAILLLGVCALRAQSAAERKLSLQYSPEQLANLEQNGHYKYVGKLLYYGESWLVNAQGQLRAPSEAEILAVDIDQYMGIRQVGSRVNVHDAASGLDLVLLSRDEFEVLYLARMNPADKAAYLTYKTQATAPVDTKIAR